jgi:hypothetical protein
MYPVDRTHTGTFTPQQLERLSAYRAAVAAGFYTDWDGSAQDLDTEVLASLRRPDGELGARAYPFTREERQRLERCREAFAAGSYADDVPPLAASATGEDAAR